MLKLVLNALNPTFVRKHWTKSDYSNHICKSNTNKGLSAVNIVLYVSVYIKVL